MADTDIQYLADQHSDIRREAVEHTNEIVKESIKGDFGTLNAIKDSRFETVSRVENAADRLGSAISDTNFNLSSRVENANDRITKDVSDLRNNVADRFYTVGRDTQDIRAQLVAQQQQMVAGFNGVAKDTEIAALKTQMDAAKNTQYLADRITSDGEKTRGLISDLKYHDLNRHLLERSHELVDERQWGRHWYHNGFAAQNAAQFASVQSQMQNLNSQLGEARNGIVNLGTMAGTSQSANPVNIR